MKERLKLEWPQFFENDIRRKKIEALFVIKVVEMCFY